MYATYMGVGQPSTEGEGADAEARWSCVRMAKAGQDQTQSQPVDSALYTRQERRRWQVVGSSARQSVLVAFARHPISPKAVYPAVVWERVGKTGSTRAGLLDTTDV